MANGAAAVARPLTDHFSSDYATARKRFRRAADAAGARRESLALAATGPDGARLTIDIAWLGEPDARHVLLHTSGIHGVEAFAGSAVQLAVLDDVPAVVPGRAVVLVHVLNPYGMAWLRRTNENNVDLNRNFLGGDERWAGAPPLYAALDELLNPPGPPRRDAFLWRALLRVLRYGYPAVKQAVAQGQYDFPRGLFYGGARIEEGPRVLLAWLASQLSRAQRIVAIDVHTGLGTWAADTLLVEPGYRAPPALAGALQRPLVDSASGKAESYVVKGGLAAGVRRALPHAEIHALVQEFGTYSVVKVISALRDENRAHFHAASALGHPAKSALRRALCPEDSSWRAAVVERGVSAVRAAYTWLQREE
ncbi:MAG TPA: DUF2817 domain-containing protein [Burkholderiales bacterium]|nr:DUF2817 domain-containing protein [Burkholderiales bacterium]